MTPWRLKKIIKKYGIKTILNLRAVDNYMYERERQICKEMGVEYVLVSISSRTLPKVDEIRKLKNILENSKKPLLMHCKAGADRTGFVATLYHISRGVSSKEAIKKELKLSYGYASFSKAGRIKKFFSLYDNKEDFLKWSEKNREIIQKSFESNAFFDFLYDKVLKRE